MFSPRATLRALAWMFPAEHNGLFATRLLPDEPQQPACQAGFAPNSAGLGNCNPFGAGAVSSWQATGSSGLLTF